MKSSYQDFFKPGHAEINRLCKFMSIMTFSFTGMLPEPEKNPAAVPRIPDLPERPAAVLFDKKHYKS